MASRRQYLTQAELADFADITIIDPTEADDQISQAEELIDAFIGPQDEFFDNAFSNVVEGLAKSGSTTFLVLEDRHSSVFLQNFFTFCEIEIIGGAGQGQRTIIASSTFPSTQVNFRDAVTTPCDGTSFYRIYQLGKFPRKKDVYLDSIHSPNQYYKNIPENIKRATAAQVEYMIQQGNLFFKTDDIFKNNERFGDYTYDKARDGSGTGLTQLIAPKAKMLLQGYLNRKGTIIVQD
jgi:hypothetical protein